MDIVKKHFPIKRSRRVVCVIFNASCDLRELCILNREKSVHCSLHMDFLNVSPLRSFDVLEQSFLADPMVARH